MKGRFSGWIGLAIFVLSSFALTWWYSAPNLGELTVILYNTLATILGFAGTGILWAWYIFTWFWGLPWYMKLAVFLFVILPTIGWIQKTLKGFTLLSWPIRKAWESFGRFRKGPLQRFKKRHGRRIVDELKARAQKHASKGDVLLKWNRAEGYEPKSFRDNRVLLFALMDYSLRLDIFHTKWYAFEKVIIPKMNVLSGKIAKYRNKKQVRRQIRDFRSLEPGDISTVRSTPRDEEIPSFGWTVFDKVIVQYMNRTLELMYDAMKVVNTATDERTRITELKNIRTELLRIQSILSNISSAAAKSHNQFYGRVNALGVLHHIRSKILNIYDMHNMMGVYEHDYLFTRAEAKFRVDPYRTYAGTMPAPRGIEVNRFGLEVDKVNKKDPADPPKKLLSPRNDSEFIENFLEMLQNLNKEWKGFVFEFRRGVFSRQSRSIQDYADAFGAKIDVHLNDDAVEFKRQGGIAFDRRALANPGLFRYWGRMKHNDEGEKALPYSPYPRLTVLGITAYLASVIEAREKGYEAILEEFLGRYPMDTGDLIQTERDLIEAVHYYRKKEG
ncbi:hypothetical protein HYY71_00145 [Candidatus Woesearchaeota archaeon]|nr:hypothetical protein [Candidatus Woesearchaeota archaeon]